MPEVHVLTFGPLGADQFDELVNRQADGGRLLGKRIPLTQAAPGVGKDFGVGALGCLREVDGAVGNVVA